MTKEARLFPTLSFDEVYLLFIVDRDPVVLGGRMQRTQGRLLRLGLLEYHPPVAVRCTRRGVSVVRAYARAGFLGMKMRRWWRQMGTSRMTWGRIVPAALTDVLPSPKKRRRSPTKKPLKRSDQARFEHELRCARG